MVGSNAMIKILLTLSLFALCWLFTTIGIRRWRAYRDMSAEREAAQAALLIGAQREAADASKRDLVPMVSTNVDAMPSDANAMNSAASQKNTPSIDPHPSADATRAAVVMQKASSPSIDKRPLQADDNATSMASNDANAPLALDVAGLKRLRPSRFARVCIAYFECTGLKARKFTGDAPIDALLFLGDAQTPMMALRWARSADHPAGSSEVIKFGTAAAQLRIQHAHFLAPRGTTLNATKAAVEQSVSIINAEHLAAKIAALPAHHLRALTAAASG